MNNNKIFTYLSISLFILISITLLSFPFKYSLDHLISSRHSSFIAGASTRILIIFLIWKMIVTTGLIDFNRISYKIKDVYPLILPLIIIGVQFFFNFDQSTITNPYFAILVFSSLIAGLAEELSFRGIILPLLIKKTNNIIFSAILSSILFALFHYVNLIIQPGNFGGITSQVIFAFAIGIFFSGVFLRTENIMATVLLHALFNIAFTGPEYFQPDTEITKDAGNPNFSMSISVLIVFSIIFVGGLLTLWGVKKERIFSLLDPKPYNLNSGHENA